MFAGPCRRLHCLIALPLAVAVVGAALAAAALSPEPAVPPVYASIVQDSDSQLAFQLPDGASLPLRERAPTWTVTQLRGNASGTATGLALDFKNPAFNGTLVYGLVPYHDTRYPQTVFRSSVAIKGGKVEIDIKGRLAGLYDMVGWQQSGRGGVVGYRVISAEGAMLYDGRVRFKGTGPFEPDVTVVQGPFVSNVTSSGAVVWFELDRVAPCLVAAGTREFPCKEGIARQEIAIDGLAPASEHAYTVRYGEHGEEKYGFRTAPKPGARQPFVFGYASDSRGGQGGGDRNLNGANAHIMRPLMAVALARRAAFLQFTGDLVGGPVTAPGAIDLQFENWKRAVEPWAHWVPFYAGVGNHEGVLRQFSEGNRTVSVDRFPFATESMEATFARNFVNPVNGPASEDGAAYDPNPSTTDFPSYEENAFSYIYDNAAVVVLNSNYWYAPSIQQTPQSGGNLHGYVMDNQLAWLGKTLDALERNAAVDHVFLTLHTPMFPNGGHSGDDMWYSGRNEPRPTIAGKPVSKGIIERRDEIVSLIQAHPKVLAVLTGDEHNYNRMKLGPGVEIYPAGWNKPKVKLARPFFQINNGAAGAPYYAQEKLPWSPHVEGFSTQNALCLLHVEGKRVRLEVVNPTTLEVFDRVVLR